MRSAFAFTLIMADCGGSSSSSSTPTHTPSQPTPPANPYCGDGYCSADEGESCNACPADCDTRALVCGNGECQAGENEATCYADCGPDDWYADWVAIEEETFDLINERRAQGATCPGGQVFAPTAALTLDPDLREAARLHSWDTGYDDYIAHPSCNGRTPWNRAQAQGAEWRSENLARGYSSPTSAVNAWMNSSSGHCEALMNPARTHAAVGYAKPMGENATWSLELW